MESLERRKFMKIDLINMKDFIKINGLREVTNPVIFEKGNIPSPDGLLSTEIFGVSVKGRKETFAYVSLNGHFLHPFIYKLLKRMDKKFEHIVYGSITYSINDKGELVEDPDGETGLEFLYDNWEKINFKRNNSMIRNERIDVLEAYKKDTLFTEYWIINPPFYRDVNLQLASQGKISHHEINDKYSKLIRMASILKNTNNFDFVLNTTRAKVQELLVEIYDFFKGKIEKKQGLIRKSLLGKSIDYGARSVISATMFTANKPDEMEIDFYHTGIPLAQCCSLFTPFIVAWVQRFFQRELEKTGNKFPAKIGNEIKMVKLVDPEIYFNEEFIKKKIDRFIFSTFDRFEKIELPVEDEEAKKLNLKPYLTFIGREYRPGVPESESPLVQRPATWCDLLYQAAVDVTQDKHVFITRYPILDYFGTFPSKITVLSTYQTVPMYIGGRVYKNYPYIDLKMPKEKIAVSFIDTVIMSNLYLKGLGGDYDGDQVTVKSVFSQEANLEADKIMHSKSHIINIYGENMRQTTNEGVQTLYMMTRFEDK